MNKKLVLRPREYGKNTDFKKGLSERIQKAVKFAKKQKDFQRQQFERSGGKKPYERLGIVNAMQSIINILEGRKENYNK